MSVITVPVTEARQRFTEIVKGVEDYFDRYLVTKNGKDAAIVMSSREYESLLETLDVLSSKKEMRALLEGTSQSQRGETVALDQYLVQKKRSSNRGKRR